MQKIIRTVFGSHLYRLETPSGDIDYKGIYLPSLNDLLLHSYKPIINKDTNKHGKNSANDIDEEWFALPKFIQLATRGETVIFDMIFSDKVQGYGDLDYIWEDIQYNRHRFITKNLKSYVGYLRGHIAKNNQKGRKLKTINKYIRMLKNQDPNNRLNDIWDMLPVGKEVEKGILDSERFWEVFGSVYKASIKVKYCLEQLQLKSESYGARIQETAKNNIDYKAASHALRAGYQIIDLYEKQSFSYPLAQTDFLRQAKAGKLDYETVISPELDRILSHIAVISKESNFPDTVDTQWWNNWLLRQYKDYYKIL